MSPTERIRQLLIEKPGLKAGQVAEELGIDRADAVAALHSLGGELTQDSSYRWWPAAREPRAAVAGAKPRTFLETLCRYYLECLSRESGAGVSLRAAGQDFVELSHLPFVISPDPAPANARAIRRIMQKVRRERGQLALFIGYATRVRSFSTADAEESRIEPVLLYPIDDPPDTTGGLPQPASGVPLFNLDVLKSLPSADSGNVIDEAIQLSEELGLANTDDDLPQWDEIIMRLQRSRPDWNWREDLNPYELSRGEPLNALTRPGIYNRAVLFAGTRSPFTYSLEAELRRLAQLDEEAVRDTALGLFLRGGSIESPPVEDRPILELLPLNSEQRQAVLQGLSAPLTVVTGPPGTGKSQVVISLLAGMAFAGRSVLFASKNNHAVDVVESRANELGPYPVVLRLGKEEHQGRLVQHLTSGLAESSSSADAARYAWLTRAHAETSERFAEVQREIASVVSLRNEVDERERGVEPARSLFSREEFNALVSGGAIEGDPDDWAARVRDYGQALDRLRREKPLEQLAGELTRVADEASRDSLELWQCWLRLQPSRWTPEVRRLLAEYVALLQMIAGGDRFDEGAGRKVFRRYYSLFPRVTRVLPCWAVTSLSARGRLPLEPGFFDLVVIDEASQCDIASALPLLYRARRAAIIGDPLQLKHVSTMAPQEDRLVLAAHGLAEGQAAWAYSVNSLFDAARSLCRHEDIVNLRDHHRSHRDIITFSNRHFYRGRLRVATDHQALKRPAATGPAVRWLDIRGRVVRPAKGGAVNGAEAEAVVGEVKKLIVECGYGGAVGAVTPFRAQANRIRTLVHQDPDLSGRLTALQFVVDTVHGFQGDERDVIFFSPVVSQGVGESTLRFLKNHGNLFNVAITRARSELVVVGDRQAALESGVGYLASFAEYAEGLNSVEPAGEELRRSGPEYPPVARPELVSEWERVFYRALYAAGLRPVPQYEEAPYRLDFALFDEGRKLDIEVDGENYHRAWDGELCRRDQIRTQRLADLGWEVMRFWVYEVRDDLERSVQRVKTWVEAG